MNFSRTLFFGRKAAFALALALGLFASESSAAPIFFTDEAAFDTATGDGLNFEGFNTAFSPGPSRSFSGFSFSEQNTTNPNVASFDTSDGTGLPFEGSRFIGYIDRGDNGRGVFSFDQDINAFGLYIGLGLRPGQTAELDVYMDGNVITRLTATAGSPLFFGVIDPMNSFSSIGFDYIFFGTLVAGFDSLSFGTADLAVPVTEPGTLALLGLGLAVLGFARHRKIV